MYLKVSVEGLCIRQSCFLYMFAFVQFLYNMYICKFTFSRSTFIQFFLSYELLHYIQSVRKLKYSRTNGGNQLKISAAFVPRSTFAVRTGLCICFVVCTHSELLNVELDPSLPITILYVLYKLILALVCINANKWFMSICGLRCRDLLLDIILVHFQDTFGKRIVDSVQCVHG